MSNLLAARLLMALSLIFHILFACAGMAMPLLMVIAEGLWLKTRREEYLVLAKQWAKGVAVLFAVGAVSGTVLSFELGLLWPRFMAFAGPVIGMPFSLEGFAFFLEAIFLGIYLYGWKRVPARAHWLSGVGVSVFGAMSGVLVVTANAWMNSPEGFEILNGEAANISPFAAMFNSAALTECLHSTLSAFAAIGFAAAAIHAYMLLKDRANLFHRRAYAIALAVGGAAALLMPLTGDLSAKHLARRQPVKFAAMEGQWETQKGAPLRLGGWPDEKREETRYALEIPYGLSFLATLNPHAEIKGLKEVPPEDRPPVGLVHLAFQAMVAAGFAMMAVALLGGGLAWKRRRLPDARWYLWLVTLSGPLGFIAVEAGWTVTEVGRQPWTISKIMRTSEAVTPMPWLVAPFVVFTFLYLFLAVLVVVLLRRQVIQSPNVPA
ncbi:MAG: cytochrome ubiquinol oxidase subunit I [Elusimicrobia bacterium]|nr:cytochrome ubiquinol oxidase subunit I [Elusimicrobiota bacterium]